MSEEIRSMPNSFDAEQGVLGSIFCDPERCLANCAETLKPEYFYHEQHRIVYRGILELWDHGKLVDGITVKQHLADANLLERAGGFGVISGLAGFPTAANLEGYAETLREKFLLREVIKTCSQSIAACYDRPGDALEIVDTVQNQINGLDQLKDSRGGQARSIREVAMSALDDLEKLANPEYRASRMCKTGFHRLDEAVALVGGQSTVIGALTSRGKTALATQIGVNVAGAGWPVLFVGLEQRDMLVTQRMLAAAGGANLWRMRNGQGTEQDFAGLQAALRRLKDLPFHFMDRQGPTLNELKSAIRQEHRRLGIKCVLLDYMQKINRVGNIPRDEHFAQCAHGLQDLANELDIPIVILSQLNRESEGRKPGLQDLLYSSGIEQAARNILLLHKESKDSAEAVILVEKNSEGPSGIEVPLVWNGPRMRFENPNERRAAA